MTFSNPLTRWANKYSEQSPHLTNLNTKKPKKELTSNTLDSNPSTKMKMNLWLENQSMKRNHIHHSRKTPMDTIRDGIDHECHHYVYMIINTIFMIVDQECINQFQVHLSLEHIDLDHHSTEFYFSHCCRTRWLVHQLPYLHSASYKGRVHCLPIHYPLSSSPMLNPSQCLSFIIFVMSHSLRTLCYFLGLFWLFRRCSMRIGCEWGFTPEEQTWFG